MAHDDRELERREREQWRGERAPRPERLGDRNARGLSDDPDAGAERYGSAGSEGFGADGAAGPMSSDPDGFSAPGFDGSFGGPRFDRADVGSTGTHGVHPVSSAFGAGYSAGYGTSAGGFQSSARLYAAMGEQGGGQKRGAHDPQYSQWRSRQMEELDRDYDEYRREKQSSFEREFGAWREKRGQQRQAIGRASEHMDVVGSDGNHVGTVDKVTGDSLILTRSDANAGGIHHRIPCSWVESVEDKVCLNLTAEEAMHRWREEQGSQAMFDRGRNDSQAGDGSSDRSRSYMGSNRRHD